MASVTARLTVLGDNLYGDQERDANSLLMELDKGLHSPNVGEQCEAIVRFPWLFEKYPFPILINSSFLKVAEVFKNGSNFLRLCVLQVTQQSQKHLEKIISVEEFLRRIYTVMHSNDPVARALTLRTLGSIACIVAEKKNVHHSIINSLDSHDKVELEAAITAASSFVARSRSFTSSICGKLAEMVESLSFPIMMKLKIISIFENMNCNLEMSQRVRSLCAEMLESHPSRKFVLALLHTLTKLAIHSLDTIPAQMELLLRYLRQEIRGAVKLSCLRNLCLLARHAPHLWTETHITALCEFLKETTSEDLQLAVVTVWATLSKTVAVARLPSDPKSPLMEWCTRLSYHHNIEIELKAIEMFVGIIVHAQRDKSIEGQQKFTYLLNGVSVVLEMMLTLQLEEKFTTKRTNYVACLKSTAELCFACPAVVDRFVCAIVEVLQMASGDYVVCLCDCLSAITCMRPGLLHSLVPTIIELLDSALTSANGHKRNLVLLSIVRLLFEASIVKSLDSSALEITNRVLDGVDGWTAYKIGRQAGRYGHHSLAADVFGRLSTSISTEHNYFWLTALKDCCLGESFLQSVTPTDRLKFVEQMMKAESHYQKAIIAIKAAATPSNPLIFQAEYMQLRSKMIQSFVLAINACCSFQTSPPPAIASSLASATGNERHRCEHVLIQLSKCNEKFKNLQERFLSLYQSSFDADPSTLANLKVLLEMCQLVSHVMEAVLSETQQTDKNLEPGKDQPQDDTLMEQALWRPVKLQVMKILEEKFQRNNQFPLTHQDIECIESAMYLLSCWHQCLPRYLFQRLQTTDVKLAISPRSAAADPIMVHNEIHLTLKVEGVIQTGSQKKRFHHVDRVRLFVHSLLQSRAVPVTSSTAKVQDNPTNDMVQTVKAHNDYFSAQFILLFPTPGTHLVTIEASVIDRDGDVWKTGPKQSVLVKSYNEATQKHQVHFSTRTVSTTSRPSSATSSLKLE